MIGERIKELRKQKGYSITELAEISGVSKSYLSYIERNLQNNPSLQFLSKLLIPLDTTLGYLLGTDYNTVGSSNEVHLDDEWKEIIQKAISEGMNKEDFQNISDFITFNKWVQKRHNNNNHNDDNHDSTK